MPVFIPSTAHNFKLLRKFKLCLAAWILVCYAQGLEAQSSFWQTPDSLNKGRLIAVGSSGSAFFLGSMIGLNSLWYADTERSSFHFFNDNAHWLQMDKAGHAFSGYQLSRLTFESVRWTGVAERNSAWAGAGFGMLFLTGVEVLDGFSAEWGFSVGDAAANLAGAGLFLGQQLGWQEQRISLKFGYSPSQWASYRPETLGATPVERMLKDYNGQTYWLSINPSAFRNRERHLLPWLNVAVGYGAHGMLGGAYNPPFNDAGEALPSIDRYRQVYVSLDVDFKRIKTNSGLLRTLFSVVNVLKFPAPAIEFSNGNATWHWLHF